MAISIINDPGEFGRVKSPMEFKFSVATFLVKQIAEVWIERQFGSGTFEFAFSAVLLPEDDYTVSWRIEKRIKSYLSYVLPDIDNSNYQSVSNSVIRYRIKYAEVQSTQLQHWGDYYHENTQGSSPYFYSEILLKETAPSGVPFMVITDSIDSNEIDNIALIKTSGSTTFGSPVIKGQQSEQEVSSISGNHHSISIPTGVFVSLFKYPVTYQTSDIFYAWLAGNSKFNLAPKLLAPNLYYVGNQTSFSFKAAAVSKSYKQETGFEWQVSEDANFSSVQINHISEVGKFEEVFDDLPPSQDWYVRVRERGNSPGPWSSTMQVSTLQMDAVSNVQVTPSYGEIMVTFDANSETQENFGVEYKKSSDSVWQVENTTQSPIELSELDQSSGYDIRIIANHTNGNSPYSEVVSTTTLTLAAPSDPVLTPGYGTIDVDFTSNSNGDEDSFDIEITPAGDDSWSLAANIPANQTHAVIDQLPQSTDYEIQIKAVRYSGDSAYSAIVMATTLTVEPPALTASLPSAPSQIQIDLVSANSGQEDGFELERSLDGSTGWTQIGSFSSEVLKFINKNNVLPDTNYFYRARAIHISGNSEYSNVDSIQITWKAKMFGFHQFGSIQFQPDE